MKRYAYVSAESGDGEIRLRRDIEVDPQEHYDGQKYGSRRGCPHYKEGKLQLAFEVEDYENPILCFDCLLDLCGEAGVEMDQRDIVKGDLERIKSRCGVLVMAAYTALGALKLCALPNVGGDEVPEIQEAITALTEALRRI